VSEVEGQAPTPPVAHLILEGWFGTVGP